jgi:hypothetical protein
MGRYLVVANQTLAGRRLLVHVHVRQYGGPAQPGPASTTPRA